MKPLNTPIVCITVEQPRDPGALFNFATAADKAGVDLLVVAGTADGLVGASWLIAATNQLGLAPSLPSSYAQPFHAARALSAMDHLSKGRMGYLVTSDSSAETATHFGLSPPRDAAAKAADYAAAAQALWDSWDADALVIDKTSGVYLNHRKVRRVDYRGPFFKTMGALNAIRPVQGYPVLIADDADANFGALAPKADVLLVAASATKQAVDALRAHGVKRVLAKVPLQDGLGTATRDSLFDGVHITCSCDDAKHLASLSQPARSGNTLRSRLGLSTPINRFTAGAV